MMTSPTRPMAWLSDDIIESAPRSWRMSSAAMVSLRMRLSAKARSSGIDGSRWWHTISMSRCSSIVLPVKGRVGLVEDGSTFLQARDLDDVRRMAAAGAFGVEGVDGAALERLDRVLDEAGFVERVGVDHHLHVVIVGDRQAAIDRRRRRAPVLVQLQRAGAGLDHFVERRRPRGIALAGKAEIHRKRVGGLDHARDMPGARRAGGGEGAVRRPGAAAEHRGDARHQRFLDLLRADEMDVGVEAAGGEDLAFAGDDLGARADDDVDAGLDVGIAGLADGGDAAVLEADIGFDDAPMIEDERIGDDGIDRALPVGDLRLAHAVADHLAAAEFHLLAIDGEILLDFDDEIGVGEAHAVAGRSGRTCRHRLRAGSWPA